jgi:uncharacterized protein
MNPEILGRFLQKFTFILCFFFAASHMVQAQAINTSSIYRNDSIGVRGAFAPEWNVITNWMQAPDELKPNFPEDKGPNDSPLFIGMHASEQLFMRLLSETYFDDLEAYISILLQGIQGQGLEITAARMAVDNSAVEINYHHPQLGLRFRERVSLLPDSQVVRMAVWSSELTWNTYEAVIEDAFNEMELKDAINAETGWQSVWKELELRLDKTSLAGVPLAQLTPPVQTPQVCSDPASSMLWRVDSPVLAARDTEIYLFGSIHVGKATFYPLAEEIESVFQSADYVVFEVDPSAASDPSVLMDMQTRGMLPQGQTLNDVISEEVVADFRRVMANVGMPADNFMGMQPWFLTLMLSSLQLNALGYLPQYGLENYFLGQKTADVEILELESIQQQIGFLEALNAETYLAYTINSFETGNDEIEELINAWVCADKGPLEEILFADFENEEMGISEQAEFEGLMEALYTRRNIDMADKIAEYASAGQGSYFVVVGSAHLLGEASIVELLKQRSLQVTPVSLTR